MSNLKISALPASTTPLAGTEVLPVVQSGATKQVSVANLTVGRTVGVGAISQTNAAGTIAYTGYTSGGSVSEHTYSNTPGLQVDTYQSAAGPNYTKTTDIVANADSGAAAQLRMFVTLKGAAPSLALVAGIDGNVTVSQGNLVIGTSGKGIDFSATAGTGTSELLNDYEEGTCTLTLGSTGTQPSPTVTSTANYTKIGNQVTVVAQFYNKTITGATGSIKITGFPFTAGSLPSNGALTKSGLGTSSDIIEIINGTAEAYLYEISTLSSTSIVTGSGKYLYFTISYFV